MIILKKIFVWGISLGMTFPVVASDRNVNLESGNVFTETELSEFVGRNLDETTVKEFKVVNSDKSDLEQIKNSIVENLKDFKVSGMAFTVDPNIALIYDSQNPKFKLTYKNSKNEQKTRIYKSKIKSWGFKLELTFKLNFIFFTGTDFNFYDSEKEINLGYGVDISSNLVDFTYVSFLNAPGGMIIVGIPIPRALWTVKYIVDTNSFQDNLAVLNQFCVETFGFEYKPSLLNVILNLGLSIVTGGYLKPVDFI